MRIKRTILATLLVVTIGLFWSLQAGAYNLFSGDNNCDQCHPTFTIGGAQHSTHTAIYSCSTCHSVEPIPSSTCLQCHDAPDIFESHGGLVDQEGYQCGYCHEGVPAEAHSWTELKNIFE